MTAPLRIERSRRRGWRMPENSLYVGRGSLWGNPFLGFNAARLYRRWLGGDMSEQEYAGHVRDLAKFPFDRAARIRKGLLALRGKNLACWCEEGSPGCHADVLIELANEPVPARAAQS